MNRLNKLDLLFIRLILLDGPICCARLWSMDVLADVLAVTRLANTTLCSERFAAPWGLVFEPASRATFHIVSRGSCWLLPGADSDPVRMHQGDVVLLARGLGHALADHPDTPAEHFGTYGGTLKSGPPEGDTVALFCGAYYFELDGPNPILSLLPPVIHLPADRAQRDHDLQAVVQLLMRESADPAPGSQTVITRLMDVLFVYVVRTWLKEQPERAAGWIGALRDPQIGKVLSMIHAAPQQRWTVDLLAKEAFMSRAAFAKRFTTLVQEAPQTYLRRWRMDLAARLLRETEGSVGWVANQVGYESETAFSATFRRSRAVAPGRYRARHKRLSA